MINERRAKRPFERDADENLLQEARPNKAQRTQSSHDFAGDYKEESEQFISELVEELAKLQLSTKLTQVSQLTSNDVQNYQQAVMKFQKKVNNYSSSQLDNNPSNDIKLNEINQFVSGVAKLTRSPLYIIVDKITSLVKSKPVWMDKIINFIFRSKKDLFDGAVFNDISNKEKSLTASQADQTNGHDHSAKLSRNIYSHPNLQKDTNISESNLQAQENEDKEIEHEGGQQINSAVVKPTQVNTVEVEQGQEEEDNFRHSSPGRKF